MKDILEKSKRNYLSFDIGRFNKKYILNQYPLTFTIIENDKNNLTNSHNSISINSKNIINIEKDLSKGKNTHRNDTLSNKQISTENFLETYNLSIKKIFEKRLIKNFVNLQGRFIPQNKILKKFGRNTFFHEDNYPYSLYFYKTQRNKENLSLLKEDKCILELIDNDKHMYEIKSFYNEKLINKEKIFFHEKENYSNLIKMLSKKIIVFKYDDSLCMTKYFYSKKNYNKYLEGKLSINSISIKITNLENGYENNLVLPFDVIPLYLSIPINIFCFFISKILLLNNFLENEETNILDKIFIDRKLIEKYLRIISTNFILFDKNSNLFEDKKLKKEIYYLFLGNKICSISIIPPYIELSKNENKIKITKTIGKGLWLALFQNNYKNWDTMCLIYLYSFAQFRRIQYSTIKHNSNQIININIDDLNNNEKINYIPKINDADEKIYFYIYNDQIEDSNKNGFIFITLILYSLAQIYIGHVYKFLFNLEQTKLLLNLNKENLNLLPILYKCSNEREKHNGISLNFSLIKAIQKNKKNTFYETNRNNKLTKNYKYIYKKGLNIKLILPKIEIHEIDMTKVNIKFFEIEEEYLNKLIEMDLLEWLKTIGIYIINNYNENKIKTKNENKFIVKKNTLMDSPLKNKIKDNFAPKNEVVFNGRNKNKKIILRGPIKSSKNVSNY